MNLFLYLAISITQNPKTVFVYTLQTDSEEQAVKMT